MRDLAATAVTTAADDVTEAVTRRGGLQSHGGLEITRFTQDGRIPWSSYGGILSEGIHLTAGWVEVIDFGRRHEVSIAIRAGRSRADPAAQQTTASGSWCLRSLVSTDDNRHASQSPMNEREFRAGLARVSWGEHRTAYGKGHDVPTWLLAMRFGSLEEAGRAGHMLWCSLCHQHAYASAAGEPAIPFLVAVLEARREPALQAEALDILRGLAFCTQPGHPDPEAWHHRVHQDIVGLLPRVRAFTASADPEVAGQATALIDVFEGPEAPSSI